MLMVKMHRLNTSTHLIISVSVFHFKNRTVALTDITMMYIALHYFPLFRIDLINKLHTLTSMPSSNLQNMVSTHSVPFVLEIIKLDTAIASRKSCVNDWTNVTLPKFIISLIVLSMSWSNMRTKRVLVL